MSDFFNTYGSTTIFGDRNVILVNYDVARIDEHFYQGGIHGILYSVDPQTHTYGIRWRWAIKHDLIDNINT